jgi:hypothetical protein
MFSSLYKCMDKRKHQNELQGQQLHAIESTHQSIVRHNKEIPIWGWIAAIGYMLLIDNLPSWEYEGWALVAGWFVASTMCVINYRSCGRYHCKITGPAFFGLGILAVLDTVGVINLAAWAIWSILSAVLAVGFGLEYRYNSKIGSCCVVACCDSKRESFHHKDDDVNSL